MKHELEIEILMMDRCTKKEAEKFLKNGTTVFGEHEKETIINDCTDEEEAEDCVTMFETKIPATDWGVVEHEGQTYYIRYVV